MKSTPRIDILRYAGLRPRRKTPESIKYASFNRRMWAVTIDSLILMLIAPMIDMMVDRYQPPPTATVAELIGQMQNEMQVNPDTDPALIKQKLWDNLKTSGNVDRWVLNMKLQLTVMLMFSAICWHFWSATPGKLIMRLRVVDAATDKPISDYQIMLRIGGYLVAGSLLGLGFVWIAFSKRRQGWHDYIAGTAVIIVPWKKKAAISATEAADPSASPAPSKSE